MLPQEGSDTFEQFNQFTDTYLEIKAKMKVLPCYRYFRFTLSLNYSKLR